MATLGSIIVFGSLIVGLGSLVVAVAFPQARVRALWLSTALLAVAGWLAILSIGIFILIVPVCTGIAAVSQSRRNSRRPS